MSQTKELKTQARSQQIAEGLLQGKTWKDIAEEIGITRPHIHAIMRDKPEYRQLIIAEITEQETHLIELLHQLENSPSPQDKRTAAQELGKLIRHAKDKTQPTLTQKLNINIDAQQYTQTQQDITETLNRLPPEHTQLFWKTYNQIKQERQHNQ